MDRVDDLTFGDRLAPADDPAVERVFPDGGLALVLGHKAEALLPAGEDGVLLLFWMEAAFVQQLHRLQRDGRGGGQAGRFDARQVDKMLGGDADLEFVLVRVGTDAGEIADGVAVGQRGHRLGGLGPHEGHALGGVAGVDGAADILGVRADQEVMVHRRGDQDALAVRVGALKQNVLGAVAFGLVHHVVFALVRDHGKGVGGGHVVDFVALYAGGVDHKAGFHGTTVRLDPVAAVDLCKAGHFGAAAQLHAVDDRRFRKRQGVFPGGNDAGAGRVQGADHLGADQGVHLPDLVAGEDLKAGHPVLYAPLIEGLNGGPFFFRKGQHEGTDPRKGNVQVLAQLLCHGVAGYVQTGHQGAGLGIVPGVDDRAVGAGSAHGDVVFLFKHHDGRLIFG